MTKNPVNHGARQAHRHNYTTTIRDEVKRGEVKLEYCETSLMLADIMTKALPGPRHMDLTTALAHPACFALRGRIEGYLRVAAWVLSTSCTH
ncbi:hypothetical protein Pcac1_g29325 [Phytophthora cactorum]|nr:hypothetical protein Pcac1_g29325 [Phytophthora cactorum]